MTTEQSRPDAPARRRNRRLALLIFAALFVLYQANFGNLDEGDAVPSANLPVALLAKGSFAFDPDQFPEMFKWKSLPPFIEQDDFFFMSWHEVFGERTTEEWRDAGNLVFNGPRYYVVESPTRHTYVSTFGPMPGLAVLPFVAPFWAIDHELHTKMALRASVAKLGSASMIAAVATMIFLVAVRFTTPRLAVLLAAIYGIGTCAWAVSSQNIWQQTENQFFLMLGAFFFLGNLEKKHVALLSGLALGAATASRATGVLVLVFCLLELVLHHRKSVVPFVLGTLPFPIAIGVYNHYYFGSPFTFGQELMGHVIAEQKTGSPALWQTPLWLGALGLLVSPSRGLFVFSPVLAPAFWGAVRILRETAHRALRPFTAAALAMMAIQCRWFDWWGGHAYGYRPWLDAIPYLVLSILPVIDAVTSTRARRGVFGALFAWSVFVQGLGALTYDRYWNLRQLFVVRVPNSSDPIGLYTEDSAVRFASEHGGDYLGASFCDIDFPYCRFRLWSVEDEMITFQLAHFSECRGRRLPTGWGDLGRRL